jgi:hypothetical protein
VGNRIGSAAPVADGPHARTDRNDIGLILIGTPGFDRQLARYPQLSSRIGFAHQYRPLDPADVPPVLALY